jgi:hypothetical protein
MGRRKSSGSIVFEAKRVEDAYPCPLPEYGSAKLAAGQERGEDDAFGGDIDFAQLIKIYDADRSGPGRYSPPEVTGICQKEVCGSPEPRHICTSHVERQNLTMRMGMRRFTRLTNAFSKKVENQAAMVALHFMHYNYCRLHQTLRVTPAMQAGLADHVWELEELVALLD